MLFSDVFTNQQPWIGISIGKIAILDLVGWLAGWLLEGAEGVGLEGLRGFDLRGLWAHGLEGPEGLALKS